MRRPRSGIGSELAPLVLILACVAGSLALIVAVHRRSTPRRAPKPAIAVAPPAPSPTPLPPKTVAPTPEPEEPEPPPPPIPEDPTPKVVARFTSAEAEQLLEASRADRKSEALEAARKAALLESERWRRRESLARLQLDSIDGKLRKMEAELDELAFERDALEKERDARKAMAAQARSRPGQAILPHRGQNGTWRRPIVVECGNGTATLQPSGISFGLLDLASGFGPASNPFVAAVAREAIRIQGNRSPDGQAVVPYIFFLVRPDGIRAYYEARGRLEPLGITFGYELADQDWEVDIPDLDDVKTWDGSAPTFPDGPDPLARRSPGLPPGASPAEDEELPPWAVASRRAGPTTREDAPGGEFTWPPRTRITQNGRAGLDGLKPPPTSRPGLRYSNSSDDRRPIPPDSTDGEGPRGTPAGGGPDGLASGADDPARPGIRTSGAPKANAGSGGGLKAGSGRGMAPRGGSDDPSAAPRELALGAGPITPLGPTNPRRTPSGPNGSPPDIPSTGDPIASQDGQAQGQDDPANIFVWPPKPGPGPKGRPADRQVQPPDDAPNSVDQSPPVRHVGPFSRPLAMGLDSLPSTAASGSTNPVDQDDPTRPDGASGGSTVAQPGNPRARISGGSSRPQASADPSDARGIGEAGVEGVKPPAGSIGVGVPGPSNPSGSPPASSSNRQARSPALPDLPSSSVVDRRFEVVLVCGPKGVIVQPGSYRVTSDALKDRDGLLKKEIVALVKARRTADPKTSIEPRVRFLVLPNGDKSYWAARSQFLLSGLDWPMSTQVAESDQMTMFPSESW